MYFNKEIETMPLNKMRELQLERLKWAISHAYNNNAFYRKKYDAAGFHPDQFKSLDDMKRVPFLTKQDMRDNYPFGLFAVPQDKVVRVHSSSGTTGNATVVGYTKKDVGIFAECVARCLAAYGVTEKDVLQVAYGYGLFTGGLGLHYGGELLGCLTVPISGGNTDRQLMLIKDFGTTVLACTPSYLLNIADYIEKKRPDYDMRKTKLKMGVLGAEPWSENMRREIESRLGIQAFDIYGLSEVIGPGVSCECQEKSGLHVQEDHFYVEIIDPETGDILPEGEKGEIVYTTITKEAFPGIRYRSRDITRLYREPCKCGRTLVKMEKVTGRSDDMLIIRGVNVFPSQIENVLMEVEGTEPHYQIILDRKAALDDVEVMVEVNEKLFSDEVKVLDNLRKTISDRFRSVLGISAKITLVEPMTIARSEGKAVRVVDRRKI
ncbi:MAG TPA: phenylacetate--CoA ligase [Spirochaetota bacterium]|nr:phenylacetate--CoA ligase [Spirochaetota bacterium]HPC40208.1 phenylacetate--CoA ligase [Spirochaetota bacterium]HPL16188.1 phenylacetate--CoA ligase [Spirochaetota bacterium]HQJ69394.1 phenylacetate--CoA ligase [Spirochaetota bacterium]HRS76037.1 phenylacetate--CoA ligase [Spirochaetota bacterium]